MKFCRSQKGAFLKSFSVGRSAPRAAGKVFQRTSGQSLYGQTSTWLPRNAWTQSVWSPVRASLFWIWVYSLQSRPKLDFSSWETLHMATDVMAATTRMFFKWVNPGLFLIYFRLFKPTLQILKQQKRYEKKCPPSIRCWDSNSQPLEHEFSSLNH